MDRIQPSSQRVTVRQYTNVRVLDSTRHIHIEQLFTGSRGTKESSSFQGQDSRLKMRTFLKPASLGYVVNKQYKWGMGGSGGGRRGQTESIDQ